MQSRKYITESAVEEMVRVLESKKRHSNKVMRPGYFVDPVNPEPKTIDGMDACRVADEVLGLRKQIIIRRHGT